MSWGGFCMRVTRDRKTRSAGPCSCGSFWDAWVIICRVALACCEMYVRGRRRWRLCDGSIQVCTDLLICILAYPPVILIEVGWLARRHVGSRWTALSNEGSKGIRTWCGRSKVWQCKMRQIRWLVGRRACMECISLFGIFGVGDVYVRGLCNIELRRIG